MDPPAFQMVDTSLYHPSITSNPPREYAIVGSVTASVYIYVSAMMSETELINGANKS